MPTLTKTMRDFASPYIYPRTQFRRRAPEPASPQMPGDATTGIGQGLQRTSQGYARGAGGIYSGLAGIGSALTADYGNYGGIRQKLRDEAEMDPQELVDQAANDARLAYGRERGTLSRSLSRLGIDPSSGRYAGLQQEAGLREAAGVSGAMTRARREAGRERFGRLLSAAGLGQQALSAGLGAQGAGAAGLMNVADYYGDVASGAGELGAIEQRTPMVDDILQQVLGGLDQSDATADAERVPVPATNRVSPMTAANRRIRSAKLSTRSALAR